MSWKRSEYVKKVQTAEHALQSVRSGMCVYIQPGCAEPETLVEALLKRAPFVRNVEVVHLLTLGNADYVKPEMEGHFRHNAIFIGGNVREAVNDGRADYTPVYLSEVEQLFESGAMPLDVALIQVSPPDAHGFCSFGVGVDTTLTAAKCAKYVVAQVNDQMPRTYGDSFIHVSKIHAFVESSRPLCELPKPEITEMHVAIAKNVSWLIGDGAVIQTGIGGIPDAVLPFLMDRKDLGVHTELVSDSVIPLIEAGVITGNRKNFKPRKIILGFPRLEGTVRFRGQQSDLRVSSQLLHGGGHGNYRNLVMAPASVQEMAELTKLAFELADRYRNPAIVLCDGFVGQMMEPPDLSESKLH